MKVTEEAATKFKEILAEQKNPTDTMLRVSFGGFG
jgi:Fe-S cluster assembly iron-binding protein IscA